MVWHLGRIAARAMSRGLTTRHRPQHWIRKHGSGALIGAGAVGGGVAIDQVAKEIWKTDQPMAIPEQTGEENSNLSIRD